MEDKTVAAGPEKTVADEKTAVTRPAQTVRTPSPVRTTATVAKVRELAENQDKTVATAKTAAATVASPQPRTSPALKRDPSKTVTRRTNTPDKIGKYKIKKALNEGGMGAVYLAHDPDLDVTVVIKRLKATKRDTAAVERFKQEASLLRELQSPRIANTFEFIIEGRSFYFVQEFVDGCSVADLLERQGRLPIPLAMKIFYEACSALKTVHGKKIVHRDIKPGNLLVSKTSIIKLTDFGIAADRSSNSKTHSDPSDSGDMPKVDGNDDELTMAGSMLGTPSYMSPEQFTDASTVGPQADIYSLGVMLYEMITGKKPFASPLNPDGSIDELKMDFIRKGRYESPRKYNPSVPLNICWMINKMLRHDPNKRYQTVDPLIKIADSYLSKYEVHDINVAIATIAININKEGSDPIKISEIKPKEHKIRNIALIALAALALAGTCVGLWKHGLIQRTLLRFVFTPVEVSLEFPKIDINREYSTNIPMQAFFFEEDGNQDEVKGQRREFKAVADADSGDYKYKINPAVLTKGDYRVKIVIGSYVIWRSFRVQGKAISIVESLKNEIREVNINARAFDLYTGKEITAKTTFTILFNGKWVPLNSVPKKNLKTGKVWKVRGSATDYKTVEYSMSIDWYQDDIRITMGMDPE